jgi:uncharacterized membrane protein YgcG
MLTLVVRVPDGGNRSGIATLRDGPRLLRQDIAAAVPLAGLGMQHGNPTGDPLRPFGPVPHGDYSLVALAPTPADAVVEYGTHLLAFEPQSGPALEAESFGRLVLLAYSGPFGRELRLRRTQGGLRLTVAMVNAIVSHLTPDTDLPLRVEPLSLTRPPWWAFWRPRPPNIRPLSADPPQLVTPPLDEAAMAEHVLRHGRRRPMRRYDPDTETWRDPSPATSGDSPSSETRSGTSTTFEAAGGRFGGAGATGGWDPEPTRPPGVDSAGRIVGTAAAAGAAAAAAGAIIGLSGVGQSTPNDPTPPPDTTSDSSSDTATNITTNY